MLLLTVSIVAFGGTLGAEAQQGQAVIAGQTNTEDQTTVLRNTNFSVDCSLAFLGATGIMGVRWRRRRGTGNGQRRGWKWTYLRGVGHDPDRHGSVRRQHRDHGIGVKGETGGTGSAIYGNATASGVGVFGDTGNGTGVQARSTNGVALRVLGKATFNRSGFAFVPAATKRIQFNLARTLTDSLIFATVQQSGGFFVTHVVPSTGSFNIYINKAPASGEVVKVAWFVLN